MESNLSDKVRYEKVFAKYLECLKTDLDKDKKCQKIVAQIHELFNRVSQSEDNARK